MNNDQHSNAPDLITTKEAAALLRMSESWLAKKRREQGSGLPYVRFGGRVLYEKNELIKWVKNQKKLC